MKWVCVTPCYWRSKLWPKWNGKPDDTQGAIDIDGVDEWDYSGGCWHAKGRTDYESYDELIPRHFEPMRKILVDSELLLAARMRKDIPRKWKMRAEDPEALAREQLARELREESEELLEDQRKQKAEEIDRANTIIAAQKRAPGRPRQQPHV